ncbi:Methylamine utilization protein MauD [bacterium HR40]|nr:Methylamine utilization protein MauD [bacterium HR40]
MMEALVVSQILLWVAFVLLALALFALTRQIGVLHERIAPLGALMMDGAVEVGDAAPSFAVRTIDGRPVTVGGARADGKAQLLLFVSPTCPVCKKLLGILRPFAKSEGGALEIVLVGDGERSEQERMIREHRLEGLTYVIAPEIGMRLQVGKLPYAVLIDERGIVRAKGLVNSREHLESLLVAKETGYASIQEYLSARGASPDGQPVMAGKRTA